MKVSVVLLSLLTVLIWGFNPAVSKLGMLEIPPFAFLSLRYLLTGLVFLPFAKVARSEWKALFLVAVFANVVNNGLCYVAYQYLQPAAATLLSQTEAPVSIFMAYLFAGEKITRPQLAGIGLALFGVIVILGVPQISLYGAALILLSRVFWGGCQLIFKSSKNMQAAAFICYTSLFAFPFTAVISYVFEPSAAADIEASFNWRLAGVLIFQVFILSSGNVLWQKLIAANGINRISPFVLTEIVFSGIAGFLLFGDTISLKMGAGMLITLCGVALASGLCNFWAKNNNNKGLADK